MDTMESVDNPFRRPNLQSNPGKVYGHGALLRTLIGSISASPPGNVEVVGLAGMGKSAMLRYLADPEGALQQRQTWLQEPYRHHPQRLHPVFVSFTRWTTDVLPFPHLYHHFYEACHTHWKYPTDLPEHLTPAQFGQAHEFIARGIHHLHQQNIRPVLLLDDFDKVLSKENIFWLEMHMRAWRQQSAIIMTTRRSLDSIIRESRVGHNSSTYFSSLPGHHIGSLSFQEAMLFIQETANESGVSFSEQETRFLWDQAGGHPHLLRLAGGALWEMRRQTQLLEKPAVPLPKKMQGILVNQLRNNFQRPFQLYWGQIESQERQAYEMLLAQVRLGTVERNALQTLERKGLVREGPRKGAYVPFSPLFQSFLLERRARAQ